MGRETSDLEQLILLAILRLGDGAYGMPILEELRSRAGRSVSRAAVYVTLRRLEEKRLLRSRLGDPTPERGGRAKRYYELLPAGLESVRRSHTARTRMSEGLAAVLQSRVSSHE